MNINQDKRVKETAHPRPINAIPPMLWMQAAIITLGAFATMLSSTMAERGAARDGPPALA